MNWVAQKLGEIIRRVDTDARNASPRCPRCGLPTAGLCINGQTRQQAGLCGCVEVHPICHEAELPEGINWFDEEPYSFPLDKCNNSGETCSEILAKKKGRKT